jgi:hypothetical protein
MFFLIEYDRRRGQLVRMETFGSSERKMADEARLKLELELLRKGIEHEVVLLDAASEEAIRRTHGRYFESLAQLFAAFTNCAVD